MGEVELDFKLGPAFLEITPDDWKFIERIRTQPGGEIWLDGDFPRLPNFGDVGGNADDACFQVNVRGLEPGDFAVRHAWANAGEQTQREIRHPSTAFKRLEIFHEFAGLRRSQGLGHAALPLDAIVRDFEDRVFGEPSALERKFEEG